MPVIRRSLTKTPIESEPNQPRLLSVRQIAFYLSTSTFTVRELLRTGEIPRIRLGRKFLADRADVDAYVMKAKVAS